MTKIAIVGATGLVGRAVIEDVERLNLPYCDAVLLATEKSQGKKLTLRQKEYAVKKLTEESFDGVDIALFCAGSEVSKKYAPIAVKKGVTVVDNSSFFRMQKDVPLVASEINFDDVKDSKLIANPNCSTLTAIFALNALKPFGLKSVRYTTFQSASGAGKSGLDDLERTRRGDKRQFFCADVSKNVIAKIGEFLPNGYTQEEEKMQKETQKILHLPNLMVSATCVRVPVFYCHAVSVSVELERKFDLKDIKVALKRAQNVVLTDEDNFENFPLADNATKSEKTFVGRVRYDSASSNGVVFFCVADNLYLGASSNAVKIAKQILGRKNEKIS